MLAEIDLTIIIFQDYGPKPGLGERRAKAIAELPFEVVGLGISEAGTLGLVNWDQPEISSFGMVLNNANMAAVYKRNFQTISDQLKRYLTADMNVFTHNPWGEYGHADHVQTYRIIEDLKAGLGFKLFVSSYVSSQTIPLAKNYASSTTAENFSCPINSKSANQIADIYKNTVAGHGPMTGSGTRSNISSLDPFSAPLMTIRNL